MAGGATFSGSIPYNGELKKGLVLIGFDTEYEVNAPYIAIYDGENWQYNSGRFSFNFVELKDSILSFKALTQTLGGFYVSVFQTENFPE